MREQTRARDDRFLAGLRRGGLARELLGDGRLEAAVSESQRGLRRAEPAPYGGTTHISVVDGAGNAAALTCSTGSGSGVIVPGTGIHLNNMLGEYDLASGRLTDARPPAHEHDVADRRARRERQAAPRRRAAPAPCASAARSCRPS